MIKGWIRKTDHLVITAFIALAVSACGGGGGSDDGGGFVPAPTPEPESASVRVSLTNLNGDPITEITPEVTGAFHVEIRDPEEAPVAQAVVSAVTSIGRLVPESGTALTNDDGIATLYVEADGVDGAGTFSASVTLNEVESEGSINFAVSNQIPVSPRKLGHTDASGTFQEGVIKVTPSGAISPGGTAALTIEVVDDNLEPVTTQERLTFTSNCLFGNLAILDPGNPVDLGSKITVNFTADGCDGDDLVTATLESNGAQATGTVSIAPVVGEVISFDEQRSTVTLIGLQGTGSASNLSESANIFFQVTDGSGNPVVNSKVDFSLVQGVGNSKLACTNATVCDYDSVSDENAGRSNTDSAVSDIDGVVSTRVLSGSVASPVQVLAFIDVNQNNLRDDNEPSTMSKVLVVSTGVADQNSISLSVRHANPYGTGNNSPSGYDSDFLCQSLLSYDPSVYFSGGLETDGLCTDVFVKLADKFNNPVPDGIAATLTTEFGRIVGSCVTEGGDCEVVWTSQNPRYNATVETYSAPITINENLDASLPNRYFCPSHLVNHGPCPDDIADPEVNPPGAPRGGRSTLTVIVNGEESFVDSDGDGFYTEGEQWTNLPEAFTDNNEDGLFTPAQRPNCVDPANADEVCLAGFEEFYYDFNSNGQYDLNDLPQRASGSSLPDGLYNGVLCRAEDEAVGICSRDLLHIFKSTEIILSPGPDNYDFLIVTNRGREATTLSGADYVMYVSDLYNNPPPGQSLIEMTGSGGCSVVGGPFTVPLPSKSIPGAYTLPFTVAEDPTPLDPASVPDPDQIVVRLTLPSGNFIEKTLSCDVDRIDCSEPQSSPSVCPSE